MRRVAISARFRGAAAEPAGDPPATDPRATSVAVEATAADGAPFAVEEISYANHAVFTDRRRSRRPGPSGSAPATRSTSPP